MRRSTHLLFALVLVFTLVATAQAETHWIRFDGSMADQNAKIVIQDNSKSDFEFRMHLPGLRVRDIVVDGADWQDLDFGQSTRQANPGDPAVPVFSRWIALPQGAAPQIEVTLSNATVIENVNCAPAQAPYADCYGEPDPDFARNEKIYDKNAWWPEKPYRVEGPYVIRGLRMFLLQVYPVQINPVTLQARAYADAVVHVDFSGSKGRFFDRHQAASFQAMYEQAMNRMAFADETPPAATGKSPNGAEYVILTDPAFVDPAQDLADWKILQGYDTEIYTTDEVGTTASEIKAWVQDAYDTWDPAPEFVLFIGDSEHITPTYDDPYIASDLYYFTVDGSDIFADIAYARITADTVEELQKHITDIINYQRYPIVDSAFYTNSYHAAYFQHQGGGYEERRFLRTTEETYQWFNQYMADSPFTPHRIYVTEAAVTPRFWNQDVYLWTPSWWTYSTVDIVPELLRANGFAWNGGASDITAAVNGGTSFLTHRDHGDTDGWSDPAFVTNQVLALTNGDKQPIVWSINCLTGYFDNDDKNGECFSEAWERNENGGAVGILASTRVSYSGINDRMFWGWLDSMWPEFIPEYPTGTNNSPEWRASLLMLYGKLYMDTCYPGDAYATEGIEEFHWFGDPTQELYAGEPQTFTVSHLPIVPMGATGFDVEVNADDARVALVQNGLILGKAYSAGGAAHIDFDGPIGDMTDVHLTVTRRNYRPYETDIMVGATADGIVALNRVAYSESDPVNVTLADIDLKDSGTQTLTVTSDTESAGEEITLTEIVYDSEGTGTFVGSLPLTAGAVVNDDGELSVSDGDTILVRYWDETTSSWKSDDAYADCDPPQFAGVTGIDAGDSIVDLTWSAATDLTEPITYLIYRAETSGGQNFSTPTGETTELAFTDTGLENFVTYYYVVRARDAFGHTETNTVELSDQTVGPLAFWEEDFDDKAGIPDDWEIVNGAAACTWSDENPGSRTSENWSGLFALADAEDCGSFQSWEDYLITEPIDCFGYTDIRLNFTHEYVVSEGLFPSHATIDVSNDGGTTWHNVADWRDSVEGLTAVDMSTWADNQTAVQIRFGYTTGNMGQYWGLDNLELAGVPNTDAPTADFSATPVTGVLPLSVAFTPDTTGVVSDYLWDFGDGETSTEAFPTHVYDTPGTFDVSLTVTGPHGNDSLTKEGFVTSTCPIPQIDFTADVTSGPVPLDVQFTDLTDTADGCGPTAVEWNFGDGETSDEAEPAHTYTESGNYTVTLKYFIDYGSGQVAQSKIAFIQASCAVPVADFSADQTEGAAPLTVHFTDLSTASEGCPITQWTWSAGTDLDNPSVRDDPNPTFIFNTPGTYSVSLEVTNDGGADTEIKLAMITVTEPDDDTPADDDESPADDDTPGSGDSSDDDDDDDDSGCGC